MHIHVQYIQTISQFKWKEHDTVQFAYIEQSESRSLCWEIKLSFLRACCTKRTQLIEREKNCRKSKTMSTKTLKTVKTMTKQDCLRMRGFSYAWLLPVTWQDSIHIIRFTIAEYHMLYANFTALCVIAAGLLPIKILLARIGIFMFLLLWPWPWPDDLHIRTWPVFCGDIPDKRKWTPYVKAFESYHTETDRHHRYYIPRHFAGGQWHTLCLK